MEIEGKWRERAHQNGTQQRAQCPIIISTEYDHETYVSQSKSAADHDPGQYIDLNQKHQASLHLSSPLYKV